MSANVPTRPLFGPMHRVGWAIIMALSAFTTVYVVLVVLHTRWLSEPSSSEVIPGRWLLNNFMLFTHVILALPCLLTGPWLFLPRVQERWPKVHRWLGYSYIGGVLVSAVFGFLLAVCNARGMMSKTGFGLLAIVWFSTTLMAFKWAVKQNWKLHRRWMLRSYSVSLAVVTIRFLKPPFGMTAEEWYPWMTWVCWVPNLFLGEIYVRMTDYRGQIVRPAFLARLISRRPPAPQAAPEG